MRFPINLVIDNHAKKFVFLNSFNSYTIYLFFVSELGLQFPNNIILILIKFSKNLLPSSHIFSLFISLFKFFNSSVCFPTKMSYT